MPEFFQVLRFCTLVLAIAALPACLSGADSFSPLSASVSPTLAASGGGNGMPYEGDQNAYQLSYFYDHSATASCSAQPTGFAGSAVLKVAASPPSASAVTLHPDPCDSTQSFPADPFSLDLTSVSGSYLGYQGQIYELLPTSVLVSTLAQPGAHTNVSWCWGGDAQGNSLEAVIEQPNGSGAFNAHVALSRPYNPVTDGPPPPGTTRWLGVTAPFPVDSYGSGTVTAYSAGAAFGLSVSQTPLSNDPSHLPGQLQATINGRAYTAAVKCLAPTVANNAKVVTDIATGGNFACAIVSGTIECFGANDAGQLGNGTQGTGAPTLTIPPLTNVQAIGVSISSVCAAANGGLSCWGNNVQGQVGNGTTGTVVSSPTQVFPPGSGVATVTSSSRLNTVCASKGGAAYCWGSNNYPGQLGPLPAPQLAPSGNPIAVPFLTSATEITPAQSTICGLQSGALYCWGVEYESGAGQNSGVIQQLPNWAPPVFASGVTAVANGGIDIIGTLSTTCAIVNGALDCWGSDSSGQVGDQGATAVPIGATSVVLSPYQIFPSGVTSVSVGGFGTVCAVVNGTAYCWGSNGFGEVGEDTGGANVTTPYAIPASMLGYPVTKVSVGGTYSCALANGAVTCWGQTLPTGLISGQTVGPWQ